MAILNYHIQSFHKTSFDYGDVIFDQAFNNPFQKRLESILYNAALAITPAIRGTSKKKTFSRSWLQATTVRKIVSKIISFSENNKK